MLSLLATLGNVNLAPDTFEQRGLTQSSAGHLYGDTDKLAFLDPIYRVLEVCGENTTMSYEQISGALEQRIL